MTTAYDGLTRFEQWMAQSNLKTIRETGVTAKDQAAIVRANGYGRVVAAVEELTT